MRPASAATIALALVLPACSAPQEATTGDPGTTGAEGTTGAPSTTGDASADDEGSTGDSGGSEGSSTGEDDLPPAICREPEPYDGAWFVEVTEEVGLGASEQLEPLATGIVAGDLDGDDFPDLVAAVFPAQRETTDGPRTRFVFMNRPDPDDPSRRVFVDATDESGLLATRDGEGGRGFSVVSLGDLDGDVDLDVVACPGSGEDSVVDPCAAFLNDGTGHFELAAQSDLEAEVFWVPSSVMLDYDLDGVLDFWPGTVGQWAYGPALTSRPRLYRGEGDGRFVDVSAEVGLPATEIGGPGDQRMNFGVTSCDVDGDGDRDVLLADYYQQPNYLYINDGGTFVDVAHALGVAEDPVAPGGHTFSIACGDLDDDGRVDLMMAELRHAWASATSDHSELLLSGATGDALAPFERPGNELTGLHREHIGSAWTEGDNLAAFVDVDQDGRKDVFIASSNYPQQSASDPDWTHAWLWRQEDEGLANVTDRTPWAQPDRQSGEGPAFVDYDGDGDLDLVIGTGTFNSTYLGLRNTVRVYRNEVGHRSNSTRLRLVGSGPGGANTSGIGAVVHLTAGGRTQHAEVLGSWGHSNTQSDVTLVFGLGDACEIEKIEVHWPDATHSITTYTNIRANYPIELRQDDDQVHYLEVDP